MRINITCFSLKDFLIICRKYAPFVAFTMLSGVSAFAQTVGCDEGVIRLPDRNGTIQICSAISARVPELAKQLAQASASLGSQQVQIAELTRLVRGLTNVSRGIGVQQQALMLESLSTELRKAQQEGAPDALLKINQRLDGLQAALLGAMGDPKMVAVLSDALKGPLGEAIAKLDLGGASQQIDDIGVRLKALQSNVGEIRSDTAAIRQQLALMEQQLRVSDGARESRDQVTIDVLKRFAKEVQDLGQRGGLIETPRTYAAHYHNARILAQRGEIDLALASYRQVFLTGVQMADPVVDLTTLLVRHYGRQGALSALNREYESALPKLSYLYALQLLADSELDEVEELLFKEPLRVADFPPLSAIYLRRLHARTAGNNKLPIHLYSFQWSDVSGMGRVAQQLEKEIESGNYLAYFIDQIRGARDVEEYRSLSRAFSRDKILKVKIGNLAESEKFPIQTVDLSRSSVVLDYTYFLDPPSQSLLTDWGRSMGRTLRVKSGSIFVSIWDTALDPQKPMLVCSRTTGIETCTDMNAPPVRCKNSFDQFIVFNCARIMPRYQTDPIFKAHFYPQEMLGAPCISRVSYTTKSNKEVTIEGGNLINVFRRSIDIEIDRIFKQCRNDFQSISPIVTSLVFPPFAPVSKEDFPVKYSRSNCEMVGQNIAPDRAGAYYRMRNYFEKVSKSLNAFPDIPTYQDRRYGGKFDSHEGKCKLHLLVKNVPFTCSISRILSSKWLAIEGGKNEKNVIENKEIWHETVFPDISAPIDCQQESDERLEASAKISSKNSSANRDKVFGNTGIEHDLERYGAGNGLNCDTQGYETIISRIRLDLGLRAIENKICAVGVELRKVKLEAGQRASALQLNGCFTAQGMQAYNNKAKEWLNAASQDCTSFFGLQAKRFSESATAWVLERP